MGIEPTIWGPHMWTMIHLICLQAPETIDANVRNSYYMFFSMMPYVLPCDKCREHWLSHIQQHPLENALETRDKLFKWSVDMHNIVNKSLGKPEMSYEEALKHWTDVSTNNTSPIKYVTETKDKFCSFAMSKINYILILCMIIVFILLLFVVKKL